ncbi:MAG TPA: radical SAM protein, partial [Thermoanaerobaculia bacterium]|nr:radical SAM protein [Thermoanaerobaculia bacterium]
MNRKHPTVGVVSLGCPKNLVDSEIMLGHLQRAGHAVVPDSRARVVLVNTCGFIDRAKAESVDAILEQVERKRRGEIDRVVVAGCMVQKYGRELADEIPEVDVFLGLDELEKAPAAAAGAPGLPRFTEKPLATRLYDESAPRVLSKMRGYAYLKVGEGCDNPCSFCTIPQMRGRQRSRSIASLVAEARAIEAQGVSELVLISQDTTRYGQDLGLKRSGLTRLVEALLGETRFPWIRFLYAYPNTL